MPTIGQTDAGALLDTLGRNLPRVGVFVLVLAVGYLVAKAAQRIAERVLARVGFDRAVERGGIGRVLARTRYDPSKVLGRVVFYALLLVVLQAAFGLFGPNPVSDLVRGVLAYLPNLFVAVILVVVAAALAAAVSEIVEAALGDLPSARLIARGAASAVLVIGVFAALDQLDVAPQVVTILFVGLVAAVTGSIIVGVGGSMIVPLRAYWERAFTRLEQEGPRVRVQTAGAGTRIRARAQRRAEQVRTAPEQPPAPPRRAAPPPPQRPPAPPQRPTPPLRPVPERSDTPAEAYPGDFDLPRPRERDDPPRRSRRWEPEPERPDQTQRLPSRPRPERPVDEADLTQPLRPVRPPRPDDEPNGRRRPR